MQIEKVKIADIVPYKNNAKKHPQEQIDQIIASIEECGFNDPIAVDENNVIIEGHGRWMALKQMGIDEADCIRLTHLNEEQKKAYILIHNKLTMNTDFDISLLEIELEDIQSIDMKDFGFEMGEIDFEFDETDLDRDEEKEGKVQTKITFGTLKEYQNIENELKSLIGDATITVQMI